MLVVMEPYKINAIYEGIIRTQLYVSSYCHLKPCTLLYCFAQFMWFFADKIT